MTARVLSFPRAAPFRSAVEISSFCKISRTSATKPIPSKNDMEMAARASAVGLGCIRGAVVALTFEAAAGLVIYVVWQVLHLLR